MRLHFTQRRSVVGEVEKSSGEKVSGNLTYLDLCIVIITSNFNNSCTFCNTMRKNYLNFSPFG